MLCVALLQANVLRNKNENLKNVEDLIKEATKNGAQLVVLPECFNSPYGTEHFSEYAESIPDGPTSIALSQWVREHNIYLVGGTIPEKFNDKLYNTCTVWSPEGALIAIYRKIHLFNIDIPGKMSFRESDVITSGQTLTSFHINEFKFGLGICHDIRFEEFAKLYRLQGVHALIYPAAFEMVTEQKYFQLLQCCRAVDNQVYVLVTSPARGKEGYIAWGHSQITDPWGDIIGQADEKEGIVYGELKMDVCVSCREQAPIFDQRRTDIYDTVSFR